ncbi:ribonuclease H1 small subunit [Patellaria atrata CBS 101060]|uniref:Ribonuclease H1 small subunit n=1 Tax=Patellaria atrata CBS 101060 TaxID=1346257 RepID=A0A9P4SA06_9PEZI|nr:ribonuclease H1 small subunit [Patellaria atrata CBS 101060]
MLTIQQSKTHAGKCTPNVLPCRINHNGPVNASERYWKVETQQDGKQITYFRGRKLEGHTVRVPEGYQGAVIQPTNKIYSDPSRNISALYGDMEDGENDDILRIEVKVAEQVASFDEIMVWGHEAFPDTTEDAYVKGVDEWVSFASALHSTSDESESKEKNSS